LACAEGGKKKEKTRPGKSVSRRRALVSVCSFLTAKHINLALELSRKKEIRLALSIKQRESAEI
jgi:hypothetical protein